MLKMYEYEEFEYVQSDAQKENRTDRHDVVVVGGGPVGLTMALDLASRGIKTVLIDDNNTVSIGSRAVCYAKRTLEVWNRLGVGQRMVDKGVDWNKGKVFFKEDLAYQFDLLPQSDHNMPAMINLQQYYLEEYLIDKCMENPLIELRWLHKLEGLEQKDGYTLLHVETPDGKFDMEADWMIACDGASSGIRKMLNAEFTGQFFKDRFLIADVVMKADYPAERWFWFDPPFHPDQSVLLHKQSDNLWRIDFQLGWDADPEEEKKPENIIPRIETMLNDPNSEFGKGVEFELEWASIYQFACRRIDQFVHDRIIFAGDSAHQVSPFGARGANTGVQDVDNLAWKLELIINDKAPASLINSYHEERAYAADDNLLNSTRSTDFITPKSEGSRIFRDAVLELAKQTEFAKTLVNSGRLSMPTPYAQSALNTADVEGDEFAGLMSAGTNCVDAPIKTAGAEGWLLDQLGDKFTLLCFDCDENIALNHKLETKIIHISKAEMEANPVLCERYDAKSGTVYLIRPDQYVTMRARSFNQANTEAAIDKAIGLN